MSTLQPVQAVGLNMDFIKDHPLELYIDAGFMGGSDTICLEDGTPLFKIEHDLLSAKRRMHFIDAQSDLKLFEMMKERFSSDYYAEHPDGSGSTLFVITIEAAFMGGPTVYIEFPNVANGGSETRFECKVHTFDKLSTVLWDGHPIAEIERQSISRHCSIRIAPRVDPLPIIAIVMALTDRARKKKKGNSSMGGNSGFYFASTGTAAWSGATMGAAM